jgi:uncharacterized protein with HEPN domain
VTRTDILWLSDILDSITHIEAYTQGMTEQQFEGDGLRQDAVLRRLEIIGEAVKQLSPVLRNAYPDVPWNAIAGARDVVIHEYFRVDPGLVWIMVNADLPVLRAAVEQALRDASGDSDRRER